MAIHPPLLLALALTLATPAALAALYGVSKAAVAARLPADLDRRSVGI